MDATRFDRINKLFAERRLSRRQAMQQGAAGLAAAGLAAAGLKAAAAQDATPAATPQGGFAGEKITYLFVQSFQSGSIAPTEGTDGRYTVTFENGLGSTIYFGDRPSRDVGAMPTPDFFAGLGFPDDNPPNAALVVDNGSGGTEIAVVELRKPAYDEATQAATYDVAVLADWQESTELGLTEAPADLSALPASFGPAHLFIDDCPNDRVVCMIGTDIIAGMGIDQPFCYNYLVCIPCEPYGNVQPDRCATVNYWTDRCNNEITACHDECKAYFWNADLLCSGS